MFPQVRSIEKKLEVLSFKLTQCQEFCPARKVALSQEAEKILQEIGSEVQALPREEVTSLYEQIFTAFTACVDARITLREIPWLERWGWFRRSSSYQDFESFFHQIQAKIDECIQLCAKIESATDGESKHNGITLH